jgi:hypothetical protein
MPPLKEEDDLTLADQDLVPPEPALLEIERRPRPEQRAGALSTILPQRHDDSQVLDQG